MCVCVCVYVCVRVRACVRVWSVHIISDPMTTLSKGEQLVAIYLLTLSNLAFVPTICLAVYRRHFTLAAVFAYNCFFSTVRGLYTFLYSSPSLSRSEIISVFSSLVTHRFSSRSPPPFLRHLQQE